VDRISDFDLRSPHRWLRWPNLLANPYEACRPRMSPLRPGKHTLDLILPVHLADIDVTVSRYSNPPRPHHPPLHRGSYLGYLAASDHRRVNTSTPIGWPKCPTSLMEKLGTKLRFIPIIIVIASVQPRLPDYWSWPPCYLLPSCLSVTSHLYHHYIQNTLPNIASTLPFIGVCRVLLIQTVSLELAHSC